MTARAASFKVAGMNRDLSESAFDARFAYENMNMRLMATNAGTTLSLTNERGNRLVDLGSITIPTSNSGDEEYDYVVSSIVGIAIGYAVLDDILVVFTTDCTWKDESIEIDDRTVNKVSPVGNDAIYKLVMEDGEPHLVDVWIGDLGFDARHPIETLSNLEAEKVKKVYWVDGLNQMRLINVAGDIYGINSSHFDFTPGLEGGESVEIGRIESSLGTFPSGCVQYFFTYFNKYGQESGIFHASTLLYTSPSDRGGDADENSTCYFNVKLSGLSGEYDYVRVYAIHRTSLDAEVGAYIVGEYPIVDSVNDEHIIEFNDYGTSLTAIDTTELLYKSHDPIVAGTITQKDQRLFAGDLSVDDTYYLDDDEMEAVAAAFEVSDSFKELPYVAPEGVYPYENNLKLGEDAVKGFKGYEWYRVAVQLQSKVGTWTEPVFLCDHQVPSYPRVENSTMYVPQIIVSLKSGASLPDGFIAMRALLAQPLDGFKSIMCQGVLCPTMYNAAGRQNNAPHAAASWFMRPITKDEDEGFALHFKHNDCIASSLNSNGELQTADTEESPTLDGIENVFVVAQFHITGHDTFYIGDYCCDITIKNSVTGVDYISEINIKKGKYEDLVRLASLYVPEEAIPSKDIIVAYRNNSSRGKYLQYRCPVSTTLFSSIRTGMVRHTFFIDQGIVTFHSPDINDDSYNKLDGVTYKARIVGLVPITAGYADYDIQIDGALNDASMAGKVILDYDKDNLSSLFYGLATGPLWNDAPALGVRDSEATEVGGLYFATYPWHRQGSLNDDNNNSKVIASDEDGDTDTKVAKAQTSVLASKVFSNLRFSYRPYYFNDGSVDGDLNVDLGGDILFNVFNSGDVSAMPVDGSGDRRVYFGNVDSVITARTSYDDSDDGTGYDNIYGSKYADDNDNETHEHRRKGYLINYSPSVVADSNIMSYIPLQDSDKEFVIGTEPVSMRYKSSQHGMFSLPGNAILPAINLGDETLNEAVSLDGAYMFGDDVLYSDVVSLTYSLVIYSIHEFSWPDDITSALNNENYGLVVGGTVAYEDLGGTGLVLARINAILDDPWYELTYLGVNDVSVGDVLYINGRKDTDAGISGYVKVTEAIEDAFLLCMPTDSSGTTQYPLDEAVSVTCFLFEDCDAPNTAIVQDTIEVNPAHTIVTDMDANSGFLYLAELYREGDANGTIQEAIYGGTSKEALRINSWFVNSEAVAISDGASIPMIGDTFFGRWDCLKTYAYADGDQNSVVDITSFLVESSINLDGRTDRNRGVKDNTVMSPANFNLFNMVYDQKDTYFTYGITDHDIAQYDYPNTIIWSMLKTNGELVDTWTSILMTSYLDLDGGCGKVTSLNRVDNNVICFQESAVAEILYNESMQMSTTEGVPVEIANSGAVNGKRYLSNSIGAYNKWAVTEGPSGIYFVDDLGRSLNMVDTKGGVLQTTLNTTNLSDACGFHSWFNTHLDIPTVWNPVDFGMVLHYDNLNHDLVIVTGDECLTFSETMKGFGSFYSYGGTPYFANIRGKLLTLHPTDGGTEIYIQNEGEYNEFFGELHGYYTTVIVNGNDVKDSQSSSSFRTDKAFNTVEFRADSWVDGEVDHNLTFDMLKVWNEYQNAEMVLDRRVGYPSPLKKKFRVWRAIIPRDKGSYGRHGNRIRNPWTYVSLEKRNPGHEMTVLHDMVVYYTE